MPVHEARLLEGKALAAKIQEEIKSAAQNLTVKPKLVAIQVQPDAANPEEVKHAASGDWYIGAQAKMAQKLGLEFEKVVVPKNQKLLEERIKQFSQDELCHGIFLSMPFPAEIDSEKALFALNPLKDVEGVTAASLGLIVLRKAKLIPSTAYASFILIEQALKESGKNLKGMKVVIIGQSAIVGRPLQMMLGAGRATTIVCNLGTTASNLENFVREADIVAACAGQPNLVKGAWIKEGAIVVDVGTTEVNGKLVGDVEFEEAKKRAGFITPVPGGVGPLTTTMLMQNLMHAYNWQKGIR